MNKSKTKYVILGLLSEQSLSGYDIKRYIDTRFSFFWNESYGQIYPALGKMQEQGLIESLPQYEKNSRDKTYYKITEKGKQELVDWLKRPVETESVRLELLLKFYFSSNEDEDMITEHVRTFREHHNKDYAILKKFEEELTPIRDHDNHEDILRVIDFGIKVNEAYLAWCEETIDYLKKRRQLS